jgi:hypothetical protein
VRDLCLRCGGLEHGRRAEVDGERRVAVAAARALAGEILEVGGGQDTPEGFAVGDLTVEYGGSGSQPEGG